MAWMPEISLRESIRLNLIAAMEKANINQTQLADKLGISKGTINNWVRGNNSPDVDTVPKICKVLGVSVLDLYSPAKMGQRKDLKGTQTVSFCSNEAIKLAQDYDEKLDNWGRKQVRAVADNEIARRAAEIEEQKKQAPSPIEPRIVKVLYLPHPIQRASAGYGDPADDESAERVCVLHNPLTQMADYIMTAHGDSMEPGIHSGDMLLVRRQPAVEVGETGIFIHRGERYVKIFCGKSLHSANPDYPDIPANEDTRCVGRVVGTLDPDWIVMNE